MYICCTFACILYFNHSKCTASFKNGLAVLGQGTIQTVRPTWKHDTYEGMGLGGVWKVSLLPSCMHKMETI